MNTFCLIKEEAKKLQDAITSGKINPDILNSMNSKDTEKYLSQFLSPENAKQVNILYEKKLLLKNQDRAIFNLFRDITGLSESQKLAKAEAMKAELARKNARLFNPAEGEKVLEGYINDTISRRFKIGIDDNEVKQILELSDKIEKSKNFKTVSERVQYGKNKIALYDYVNKLSGKKAPIVQNILGLPRAVLATLDLSAPLNQGWGMMSRPEFYKNLEIMVKSATSERYYQDIQAELITRETYKGAKKAGLRISELGDKLENREEVFMTTLLDKIPGVKGSQRAYTAFLNKTRLDVYDNLVKKAEKYGEDVSEGSQALKDIANSINIFTGGYGKTNAVLNATIFSPRKVQSSLQMLNPMTYLDPKVSKTARMASLRNLLGSLGITASVIGAAKMLGGDNVELEFDPTSSDYGKLKVGDTRIDISGGNAGYITLLSRIITGKTKSTTTGIKKELGEYGADDKTTIVAKFIRNKLSPVASLIWDLTTGENAIGEKKTPTQSVIDRFKPMFINNMYELWTSDAKYKPIISALALFGANVSVYGISENWTDKDTQEMTQFKEKVGDEEFDKANNKYNEQIEKAIKDLKNSDEYKNMSDEDKQKEIKKIKDEIKKDIFKEYHFKKKALPKN